MFSTYLYLPREWHLFTVFHVFDYLVQHNNMRVMFDSTYPTLDMGAFIKTGWKDMYGYVKECVPSDAPVSCGKEIDMCLFVDSSHAGEQFTRYSRTGCVIYLNMAPIVQFSKHQPTVESGVSRDEFVAMKNGIETWHGLRYKLRMRGVSLCGLIFAYGGNLYVVVHNTQCPEYVLKKKSNSV
jgi:hypothetical protein